MKRPRLEVWASDFDPDRGGIQAYSSFLKRALREVAQGLEVRGVAKFSKSNTSSSVGVGGGLGKTIRFAGHLLGSNLTAPSSLIVVTHVNFAPAALILKLLRGQPYVVAAHGIEVWGPITPLRRWALRAASQVWAVSRYTRERLIADQSVPAERVIVLPNTFEESRFMLGEKPNALLERYRLPLEVKVILSVGRLAASERYKGFDRVIAALPEIAKQHPTVRYLIAGRGDDRARLEAQARAAGVADRVIFAGFVPVEELCAHYQLCDVFAMPSTGEGFGIVFLEAMACGKLVLAGNQDGSTEPLMDGQLGALVNPNDLPAITATISDILAGRHPNRLLFDPAQLRRRVVEEFGFERFCLQLSEMISALVSKACSEPSRIR